MADNVTNELLLEHMKDLQAKISGMQTDIGDIKADIRGIKGHMVTFMQTELVQDGTIASIQTRLDRIEQRLSLSDG